MTMRVKEWPGWFEVPALSRACGFPRTWVSRALWEIVHGPVFDSWLATGCTGPEDDRGPEHRLQSLYMAARWHGNRLAIDRQGRLGLVGFEHVVDYGTAAWGVKLIRVEIAWGEWVPGHVGLGLRLSGEVGVPDPSAKFEEEGPELNEELLDREVSSD